MKKISLVVLIIVSIFVIVGYYIMRPSPSETVSFISVTKNELPSEAISLFNESHAQVYDVYRSPDGQHDYLRFRCKTNASALIRIEETGEKSIFYVKPVSLSMCKETFFKVPHIQDEIEVLPEKK